MKLEKLEKEIELEILEFLRWLGIKCWKNVSGGYFDAKRKMFRKQVNPYAINGVSDILGIVLGKFLAIEVKSKKGRATDDQKRFLLEMSTCGAIAFIARSVEDVALELAKHFPEPQHENLRRFCKEYVKSRRTDH